MIRLAEDIGFEDYRKVPLDPKFRKVLIEVASNHRIDIAVLDEAQYAAFEESEDGDVPGIDWIDEVRSHDFEFEWPEGQTKLYLVFWNWHEKGEAIVAYKITPMQ